MQSQTIIVPQEIIKNPSLWKNAYLKFDIIVNKSDVKVSKIQTKTKLKTKYNK